MAWREERRWEGALGKILLRVHNVGLETNSEVSKGSKLVSRGWV